MNKNPSTSKLVADFLSLSLFLMSIMRKAHDISFYRSSSIAVLLAYAVERASKKSVFTILASAY